MANRKLTILFIPLDGHGHINFCHGIAEVLRDRQHRIVFAIDKAFKGRLVEYGFEEVIAEQQNAENVSQENKEEYWPEFVKKNSFAFKSTAFFAVENFMFNAIKQMHSRNKELDDVYRDIINNIKPDLIMVDMYIISPTITNCGIPWVWLFSAAPHLIFNSDKLPPHWSGLPLNDDREWYDFKQKTNELMAGFRDEIKQFNKSKGLTELQSDRIHRESPFLNIYLYPKELDFSEIISIPNNYIRIDAAVRSTNEKFSIPEQLRSKPGKLVFLSMGSFGSADIELMTRLVTILSKSQNRFIVSKGPVHDKYELPDNMWGQRMVPQIKVLPLVDLVIHHGGNNTLIESLYFGKPMIVMPLFADQYDNAQRVVETGCGLRLNPYHCSEQELLESVDQLLNNQQLGQKIKLIGERIRNSDSLIRAADRIENILKFD